MGNGKTILNIGGENIRENPPKSSDFYTFQSEVKVLVSKNTYYTFNRIQRGPVRGDLGDSQFEGLHVPHTITSKFQLFQQIV